MILSENGVYRATALEELATRNSVHGRGNTTFAVLVAVVRLEYITTRSAAGARYRRLPETKRRSSREQRLVDQCAWDIGAG